MNTTSHNSVIREILIGLLVTVIGGVLVAWIIKEGEIFQSNKDEKIGVSIKNNDCIPKNFYIDGELVASSISPGGTAIIKTTSGEHWAHSCASNNPTNCTTQIKVAWSTASEYNIPQSLDCPITITLTNNDCRNNDFYVDGVLTVSGLASGNSIAFQITPGTHMAKVCNAGTNNCANEDEFNWRTSTPHLIDPASDCTQ